MTTRSTGREDRVARIVSATSGVRRLPITVLYDAIGEGYLTRRLPDPRIAAAIHCALQGADSFVNVGAGTGSYEPNDRPVVAVEPSMIMIQQRPRGSVHIRCDCHTDGAPLA